MTDALRQIIFGVLFGYLGVKSSYILAFNTDRFGYFLGLFSFVAFFILAGRQGMVSFIAAVCLAFCFFAKVVIDDKRARRA